MEKGGFQKEFEGRPALQGETLSPKLCIEGWVRTSKSPPGYKRNLYTGGGGGGGGKRQYPYVDLNSSVTGCLIEIILSGMTY